MDDTTKTLLIEVARAVLRVLAPATPATTATTAPEAPKAPAPLQAPPTPATTSTTAPTLLPQQVLRVIAPAARPVQAAPRAPAATMPEQPGETGAGAIERGAVVRVWGGDRFECGTVQSISRDKTQLTVRIDRGEGRRSRRVTVPVHKAVRIPPHIH